MYYEKDDFSSGIVAYRHRVGPGRRTRETDYDGSEYEVTYTDRTEVEFRADGQWSAVDRKYSAVPAAIVPQQIADFVAKMNYPGQFIRKIDRDAYSWEIELSNGLEVEFDLNFNVIDYDD